MVVSNLFPPVRHAITGESEGLGYDSPSDELELDEDAEEPEEDESDFDDYGVTNDSQENSREDNRKDIRR